MLVSTIHGVLLHNAVNYMV